MGEWSTVINFSSDSIDNTRILGGLLTSAFYGEGSEPEPVHAVFYCSLPFPLLIDAFEHCQSAYCSTPYPKYGSLLSSRELAIYCALPTMDTTGLSVRDHYDFEVNRDLQGDLSIGRIIDSGKVTNSRYAFDTNEFNRHALVVGLTGSGKTNTVKSLIRSITNGAGRPFMVIEPAKKEYWELYKLGYDDLQIYSVGSNDPSAHVLCLNPFERAVYVSPDGVRHSVPIQTHIDFVFAAFKASFIMYTPMPYVLERAIYEIYEDCGWDIRNNTCRNGQDRYPTIEDLYFKIPEVVTAMGYDQKMRNDLTGSLQARINSMRLGAKGDTLNVQRSFPLERLLSGRVVVELEDIGDDDVKAFIISLLLIELLEYRRQQPDAQKEVRHLMLIEEAHRLLKNVQSGTGENADPRGAAVEFFCNLLAELRSKGQGFIVADQIPSKLAPDLVKNTNLKIVHRTVAEEDRTLVGGAMHMTQEQIDSLSSLRQGVAAVYSEGDYRPKLVLAEYVGDYERRERAALSREEVLDAVKRNCFNAAGNPAYVSMTDRQPRLCRLCDRFCNRKPSDILSGTDTAAFERLSFALDPLRKNTCVVEQLDEHVFQFVEDYLPSCRLPARNARYCLMQCLMARWNLPERLKDRIVSVYEKTD